MIGLFLLGALQVQAADSNASITFTRLLLKDDAGKILGASTESYRSEILQKMKESGLNVRGVDDAMFANGDSGNADFLLGGTLIDVSSRELAPYGVEVEVEWKMLERASNNVVYTVVTRGYAEGDHEGDGKTGSAALNDALERALARPKFREALSHSPQAGVLPKAVWSAPLNVRACVRPNISLPNDIKKVMDGVVEVRAGDSLGSGALISADGFIVTAAHVIGSETAPTVRLKSGIEVSATVVRVDEAQDVALLHIAGTKNACIPLADAAPDAGAELYAIGTPAGLDYSVSKGVVSGFRSLDGFNYLQTDAAINPGASGGPMLDHAGHALAVVSWKIAAPGFEGLGFGVPVAAMVARLGIAYGDDSDTDLTGLTGRIARPAAAADGGFLDEADPPRLVPVSAAEWYAVKKKRRRTAGIVLASVGAAAVAGTGAWALTADSASDPVWSAALAANTLGWISVAGGAAYLGVSFLPAPKPTSLDVPFVLGVNGRF